MENIIILGIKVSTLNKRQVIEKIEKFISDSQQSYIVTPNAEIILNAAAKDEELFYILNKADIAIADGIALKFAAWTQKQGLPRVTGADLATDILKLAEEKRIKIAVLNWAGGLSNAQDIKIALNNKYPGLLCFVQDISRSSVYGFNEINNFAPKILFVTLGSPWQEKFIYHNLKNLSFVKVALGVGGSFDYLTGKVKRAPKFMRRIGLEWLWRLFLQPQRWQRIFKAVIIFPYKFFLWRYIYPHRYRPNVACLLYKRVADKYKILLVERTHPRGHWQLPQGGTDGEDIAKAGFRELSEEINTDKFCPVAVFRNLHYYEFNDNLSKFGVKAVKTRGYKGQKQNLFIAEFLGADSDIKLNFWEHANWQWVDSEEILNVIAPIRREATIKFLEKFKQTIK